jgi:hypothetical protein
MNRGDVFLLVLWCVVVFFTYRFWEIGTLSTAIGAMLIGGAVFAVRLWLARRTFNR